MKELTYVLGAGASYQSFPVVDTFVQRFKAFTNSYSSDCADASADNFPFIKELEIGKVLIAALGSEFNNHQSFDTYFKKLFHQRKIKEIKLGKKILNLYFLWEHLNASFTMPENNINIFCKQSALDKRYDALIAGLLQPIDSIETYCKINFVTWNYDLNLISSIKNFFSPSTTWAEFFKNIQKEDGIWNIENKISIFNMNGFFQSAFLNEGNLNFTESFYSILKKKIVEKYFDDSYDDIDSEFIKFAWEVSNKKIIEEIQTSIANSKNIVVIGYSFPLYNRLIDLQYLHTEIFYDTKVILQDPKADNLRTTFLEMLNKAGINMVGSYPMLFTKSNCDYFYIPPDTFTAEEAFISEIVLS